MRILMSLCILLLCSCNRFEDQQVELSGSEGIAASPPCNCRINAQKIALQDDLAM